MQAPIRKNFTLLAAMILVAAFAVGIALALWWNSEEDPEWPVASIPRAFAFFLLPFAPALLTLELIPPRDDFQKFRRRTGVLLVITVLCGILIRAFQCIIYLDEDLSSMTFYSSLEFSSWIGVFVAVNWILLRLGGQIRSEQSWLDRAGRLYGVLWIADWVLSRLGLIYDIWGGHISAWFHSLMGHTIR